MIYLVFCYLHLFLDNGNVSSYSNCWINDRITVNLIIRDEKEWKKWKNKK